MTLLKSINEEISVDENLLETSLQEFFDRDGRLIKESISSFVAGAKQLIDKLQVDNETLVNTEASVQEIQRLDRFAMILAGLEYFRKKNVGPAERQSLNDLLDDKNVTNYVKHVGAEKAEDVITEIKAHFFKGRILRREGLDKMIEDIRRFYLSKKANVGPLLQVTAFQDV